MSGEGALSLAERARWSAWLAITAPRQGGFPYRPLEAIERAQRRNVRAAITHAFAHIPFYRESTGRLGLSAADFGSGADLAKLPLIDKDQVRGDPEYFTSERHPPESCVVLASGGSTGAPLTIFQSPESLFVQRAEAERMRRVLMRAAGRRLHLREATITPPVSSGAGQGAAFRRNTLIPQKLRVSSLGLSIFDPMPEAIARINEFRPDVISGLGSGLDELFVNADRAPHFEWPKVAHYAADAMSEQIVRLISERHGVQTFASYNSIEAGQIAFECEQHDGLHSMMDLCPSRIVDPEGRDLGPGERGEVVISNLLNRGTALLNYRLGDVATRLEGRCGCGRTLPRLSLLEGRLSGEWLDAPGGRRVHAHAVKDLIRVRRDVLRYQLIQRRPGVFTVDLILAEDADADAVRTTVAAGLAELFGADAEVDLRFVTELQRTKGGKVLPVITGETPVELAASDAGD